MFYFQPGHETYPTYHDENIRQGLRNAVRWAAPETARLRDLQKAPNRTVSEALEPIEERGPKLHTDGDDGYR